MTDEQNPTGDQPQEPTQPLSGSTPPPSDAPPPPPVNPYETPAAPPGATPPAAPPPYGTPPPAAPQYGAPQYGTPQYGAPAPMQPGPAAGYPGAPGAMGPAEPSKAMAITSLILSILCCFPIGLILAIVVLVRSKDGRNHGRGLAIAAVVISIITAVGGVAGGIALSRVDWEEFGKSLLPVENLETGECLNAGNLTDDDADFVDDIVEKSCDDPHDAEVLVTKELTQDDAENYDPAATTLCSDLIFEGPAKDKVTAEMTFVGLTSQEAPDAGDKLVCIAYRIDGAKLDAPL